MLSPGERVPDARVWTTPRQKPVELRDAIAGDGAVLLCFYFYDWSPG